MSQLTKITPPTLYGLIISCLRKSSLTLLTCFKFFNLILYYSWSLEHFFLPSCIHNTSHLRLPLASLGFTASLFGLLYSSRASPFPDLGNFVYQSSFSLIAFCTSFNYNNSCQRGPRPLETLRASFATFLMQLNHFLPSRLLH